MGEQEIVFLEKEMNEVILECSTFREIKFLSHSWELLDNRPDTKSYGGVWQHPVRI